MKTMRANELFEEIHSGEIKEGTKIKVFNELTGSYVTTISYKDGRLNWQAGEFDTSFLCSIDIVFVIEENKEIEEFKTEYTMRQMDIQFESKINELVRAVNKLNKEREEK